MGKKARRKALEAAQFSRPVIDCACLIHDTLYDWIYVEKLYNSLCRNLSPEVRMHVYTESNRPVPDHMIHHKLEEWPGIRGPKKSWWYKVQIFNASFFPGDILYFDLDTVITGNIDWIWQINPMRFNAARDFKYLFRNKSGTINSSVMWFNVEKYKYVYQNFDPATLVEKRMRFYGDQDYIHSQIPPLDLNYLDYTKIKSYKWEVAEGGYNFSTRKSRQPGTPSNIDNISVLVFHGNPKPAKVSDPVIHEHWR